MLVVSYTCCCLSSMRIYPQDQNTGGFFIAVIQKIADMPTKGPPPSEQKPEGDVEEEVVIDPQLKHLVKEIAGKELRGAPAEKEKAAGEKEGGETTSEEERGRKNRKWGKEDPFLPLTETMRTEWLAAKYALSSCFLNGCAC